MVLRFVEWRRFCCRYSLPIAQGAKNPKAAAYTRALVSYFTVKLHPGDSLSQVAERYDVKRDDLLALSEIPDHDRIIAGRDLRGPTNGRLREERVARPASVSRSELSPVAQTRVKNGAIPIPKPRPEDAEPAQQGSWFDSSWLRSFAGADEVANTANAPKLLWPLQGLDTPSMPRPRRPGEELKN